MLPPEPEKRELVRVSRAERRRLDRERVSRARPTHREVHWTIDAALVDRVREAAREMGRSEQEFAGMMIGTGLEFLEQARQREASKTALVQIAPGAALDAIRRRGGAGARLGGA